MKKGSIVSFYDKLCRYIKDDEFGGAEIIYLQDGYHCFRWRDDLEYICNGKFCNKCYTCKHRFLCYTT